MTEAERTLQTSDDSNFRRLGVDVNDEKFRKDYFSYRDLFGTVVGNGNLPMATILEIALRHPKTDAAIQEKIKRPVGRPKKESVVA